MSKTNQKSIINGKGWTFDTEAEKYATLRPGYPGELYKSIFDYSGIDETSEVIEVGIGGGQATLPFLLSGCILTAIEYGENLSNICREKFKDFNKFSVITSKFEDIALESNKYDLIYSASAFHWVPEEIGYSKVYSALKNGGVFARFANHPFRCKYEPELSEDIDKLYEKYYYKYYDKKPVKPIEYLEENARQRAEVAGKYGFFDIRYEIFTRTREFSAEQYVELLGTYSDHIAIEQPIRDKFFDEIKDTINKHGGSLIIYDTIDLQLSRKMWGLSI